MYQDSRKLPGNRLRRNMSASEDGRTVYTEIKTLGKVNGSEFVAVERADPSLSCELYYLTADDAGHADRIQAPIYHPPIQCNATG